MFVVADYVRTEFIAFKMSHWLLYYTIVIHTVCFSGNDLFFPTLQCSVRADNHFQSTYIRFKAKGESTIVYFEVIALGHDNEMGKCIID